MATIRAKLKQLRNADVRYISLVDRAATRIPFRVLKRDKESKMGIDLTQVFKSDDTAAKPYVSALVVFAQKDEAVGTQVQDAIKAHGFKTDVVQKSDEGETLVYAQGAQQKDTSIVRLSDQTLVSVGGLKIPEGWVGDLIEEHGFFPDLHMATEQMHQRMQDIVAKSDTPQADAEATLTSYAEYLNQMVVLPTACFKLDEAIGDIIKKCSCEDEDTVEDEDDDKDEVEKDDKDTVKKSSDEHTGHQKTNPAKEAVKEETAADKKKRVKSHAPAEMAPKDEDDDQKPPPEEVMKSGDLLKALKGIEKSVTGLAAKLETVVTEQAEQKKTLDGVVEKADTLNTTLKSTVTAPPMSEDRPANTRMRVQKQDDDPRTGNFDTAFLRRRR